MRIHNFKTKKLIGGAVRRALDRAKSAESLSYKRIIPEIIIGSDDRYRIHDALYNNAICYILCEDDEGNFYRGSGAVIGKREIATAAHVAFMRSKGKYMKHMWVYPAKNKSENPIGVFYVKQAYAAPQWTNSDENDGNYDFAILRLSEDISHKTGVFEVVNYPSHKLLGKYVELIGYPGDKQHIEQWGARDKIIKMYDSYIQYGSKLDTFGGQSGSPVFLSHPGIISVHTDYKKPNLLQRIGKFVKRVFTKRKDEVEQSTEDMIEEGTTVHKNKLCGIHVLGVSGGNMATRINEDIMTIIFEFIKRRR